MVAVMSRHLISTGASIGTCRPCRRVIFTAWVEGLLAHTEAIPVTAAGAQTLAAGGRTIYRFSHGELTHHDLVDATDGELLLPEHRCDQPVADDHRARIPGGPNPPKDR